jgi:hypothetical protein
MNLKELQQVKQDLANKMIVSPATWVKVLDAAIENEKNNQRYGWLANRVLAPDYGDNPTQGIRIGWRIVHNLLPALPGARQPIIMFGSTIDKAIDSELAK